MKKNIALLDSDIDSIEDYADLLQQKGYHVSVYKTAKKLISHLRDKTIHVDLVITDLILGGIGDENNFDGKRKDPLDDCASLLADELKEIGFQGKLIVLTSWSDTNAFKEIQSEKFSKVLTKLLTSAEDLADAVNEVLPKTIIFYDGESSFVEEIIDDLRKTGFAVKIFRSAENVLKFVRENSDIDLIVSEIVVHGFGNNFGGRRTESMQDCATLLADELDKIPEAKEIKRMVFSSYIHMNHGSTFDDLKKDKRFSYVWRKSDILSGEFVTKIQALLK